MSVDDTWMSVDDYPNFNLLRSAVCLLYPTFAIALLDAEHIQIRDCAKAYYLSEAKKSVQNDLHSASSSAISAPPTSTAASVHLRKW